jgi:DNA polymerase III epsilon subunit-like protein
LSPVMDFRKTTFTSGGIPPYTRTLLEQLLAGLDGRDVVVFDLETNGFESFASVLSFSALKFRYDPLTRELEEIEAKNRYYYCRERENPRAIAVNGLTRPVLAKYREGAGYPEYFDRDGEIVEFFRDTGMAVAHNVDFDRKFLRVFPELIRLPYYCTMKGSGRYIKLHELARTCGINVDTARLHESRYDTELAGGIFKRMIRRTP